MKEKIEAVGNIIKKQGLDAEEIWEIKDEMKNNFEKKIDFSKSGLVKLFNDLDTRPLYQPIAEGPNFKAFVSKGTMLSKDVTCFKTEYVFDKTHSFKKIAKVLINNRDVWDDNIEYCFDIRKPQNRL